MDYTVAFEKAVDHAMIYEVGGFWRLTPDVIAGLISTPAQRKAVGYVNDATDRGGETKFGVATNANPDLDIKALTWDDAKDVYYNRYWVPAKCEELPGRIGFLLFDIAVNHGVKRSAVLLQRALGVVDDGVIGPITLSKAQEMDSIEVCNEICDAREKYYNNIVAANPSQKKYLRGWLARAQELRNLTTDENQNFDENV